MTTKKTKKRSPRPNKYLVLLESMESQMRGLSEAMQMGFEASHRRTEALESRMNERFEIVEAAIRINSSDIRELRNDVNELKTDMKGVKSEIQNLKTDVQNLKTDVQNLKADVQDLKKTTANTEQKVDQICKALRLGEPENVIEELDRRVRTLERHAVEPSIS